MKARSIPLPPKATQQRIARQIDSLFAEIDSADATLADAQVGMETYRKSLLKAAVTGDLTRVWRERHPSNETGADLLARILRERREHWQVETRNAKRKYVEPEPPDTTDLPDLPLGWTWASLDQLSWHSQYGTSVKCSFDGSESPVLRIPDLVDGEIAAGPYKRAIKPIVMEPRSHLDKGDMLIIRTNGSAELIGRTAVVLDAPSEKTHFASYLIRFRLVADIRVWRWVQLYSLSAPFRARVLSSIGSSARQYNLSLSSLSNFSIAIPSQAEIGAVLERFDDDMEQQQDVANNLVHQETVKSLKQSVLDAAFRGDLVQ